MLIKEDVVKVLDKHFKKEDSFSEYSLTPNKQLFLDDRGVFVLTTRKSLPEGQPCGYITTELKPKKALVEVKKALAKRGKWKDFLDYLNDEGVYKDVNKS